MNSDIIFNLISERKIDLIPPSLTRTSSPQGFHSSLLPCRHDGDSVQDDQNE
jgi:hypothetical protein